MRLSVLAIMASWGITSTGAFDVTIYKDVNGCDANDQTMYRIITGASDNTCYTFDRNMPNTDCAQYTRGGWGGPDPCTGDSLLPKSALVRNENKACTFYSEDDCKGMANFIWDGCRDPDASEVYKSFKCLWDDSVDILGFVGCRNGVSSNACVNDCDCKCDGQNLVCDHDGASLQCNAATLAICTSNCGCINP
ncbi:hypothetical protein B0H66DRAFT_631830 [Apodospora peruviana]|uniref:Uncharacterized protein n=1 Tax=Apodospora peruviana TaxID=516989 RepID=A0AAE0HUQ4_9PEZI|nr:hypothetical protein B0H66DRAFT_631830 [Apodospora peruviana]